MQDHQEFFEEFLGKKADFFKALPPSGSSRSNYIGRSEDRDFIITYNENNRENEAFFYFTELFQSLDLNTPKIFKIDSERNVYIQEFLGNKTLSEIISKEGLSERVKDLVKKSLKKLFELQTSTLGKVDFSKSFEYESYDDLPITHDLYYFKNFFVDILEIEYHKSSLLKEFRAISEKIQKLSPKTLMIRDFQSRNILVNEKDEVFFIDYQSAMEGPAAYDVISFLYQAKANFPNNFKEEMLDYYLSFWMDESDKSILKESFNWMKLMRFLQVLGAYGFRGLIQRKAHFLASIEQGIENISELNQTWQEIAVEFPELYFLILRLNTQDVKLKIENLIIK
ncbi:aminoglycoside/choline kinase family phosphotransferase [Epilithonimonas hungarica]|jgi:Predicted phosphotransferase related to Ser/Thr protein kinases|uniref:aminoglycoside phosphotransferase family protein n=1 Tax=Epilithonimonas hungarica TaxID=454006 RepID=UPI002783A799|nr:phosphotransferase [Epilithonimonas hungarica]MDP9957498.1 aminoglycoside/choline kinase family phosphotransferase [Epilithonimonas hungarica]